MFYRSFSSIISSFVLLSLPAVANPLTVSDLMGGAQQSELEDISGIAKVQLANLRGGLPPLKAGPAASPQNSTHISLVLVGDTGYAPSRARPHKDGVRKYGSWQTWKQTTKNIRGYIDGDVNFANMESVVSANPKLRARSKAFNFVTHPNGVRHLADIGFNLFSMANNHSFDYGSRGVKDSLLHMETLSKQYDVVHAGIGLNRQEAAAVPEFSVKETKFAFGAVGIGAAGGAARATPKRPGQLNLYNNSDTNLLLSNLAKAKADYRILSVHRGIERRIRVTQDEVSKIRRRMLVRGKADLIIGHHAHVARGVEINDGRLVFYGLGNFLHQGTANMAGSGGCRDYSLLAKVHLVKVAGSKPVPAAVEIVPLTATHMRTTPMPPQRAARRIAVLNGLASQFDDPRSKAKGVRFAIRADGTGLYCLPSAVHNKVTAKLCKGYRPYSNNHARVYRAALNSCGSSFSPRVLAKLQIGGSHETVSSRNPVQIALVQKPKKTALAKQEVSSSKALREKDIRKRAKVSRGKSKRLNNRQLASLSKAQRKRYWTRYWYIKRGRKVPKHLR